MLLLFITLVVADWPLYGANTRNTRNVPSAITRANVESLHIHCQINTHADVTATPTIIGDAMYFPSWDGRIYKANKNTCEILANRSFVDDYGFDLRYMSRSAPAYDYSHNYVIVGVMPNINLGEPPGVGSYLVALTANLDKVVWKTLIQPEIWSIVTQSAVIRDGVAWIGTSSLEEQAPATQPNYNCCSSVGHMLAVETCNGNILWDSTTLPPSYSGPGQFSGVSVWDGQMSLVGTSLYIGTGQLYSIPAGFANCFVVNGSACYPPGIHFDAMLSLNALSGEYRWSYNGLPIDAWNIGCYPGFPPTCPAIPGTDSDVSVPVVYYTATDPECLSNRQQSAGSWRNDEWISEYCITDYVAAGQKDGTFWVRKAQTGEFVCNVTAGTNSVGGGFQGAFGYASENGRPYIYVGDSNAVGSNYTLLNGTIINRGHWGKIDGLTCRKIWETPTIVARAASAISISNDLMFASDSGGLHVVIGTSDGVVLRTFNVSTPIFSGVSIQGSCAYYSSGAGLWVNSLGMSPDTNAYVSVICL